jgi:hypothetical protein
VEDHHFAIVEARGVDILAALAKPTAMGMGWRLSPSLLTVSPQSSPPDRSGRHQN